MGGESSRYSIDFGPRRTSRNVPQGRYDGFYNHKDQFRIHGWPFTTKDRGDDDDADVVVVVVVAAYRRKEPTRVAAPGEGGREMLG